MSFLAALTAIASLRADFRLAYHFAQEFRPQHTSRWRSSSGIAVTTGVLAIDFIVLFLVLRLFALVHDVESVRSFFGFQGLRNYLPIEARNRF